MRSHEPTVTIPSRQTDARLRVLLIAEMANPEWVSVPLEGWYHSRALARHADVHVVTHSRNRDAMSRAGLTEGRDFSALDYPSIERPVERLVGWLRGHENRAWTLSTAAGSFLYYFFERRVWDRFGAAIASGRFDLVHRLTPLSPTAQSPIAGHCQRAGVPFVLGPLNGGLPWPAGYAGEIRRERDWLTHLRGAHRLMPGYHSTRLHAAAIVAGSRATFEQSPSWARSKTIYIPENGIEPRRFDRPVTGPVRLPLRVAFVGRLVPYKGADILLEAALPLAREGRVKLDIIGDGPELPRLKAMAAAADPDGQVVRFPGWVHHASLQQRLIESDVLGFPSVREFGGAVVLEAMALGLVPIVIDYGGPGEHVSPATGLAVPMGSRSQIVRLVRAALQQLTENPDSVRAMGERGRRRVLALYTWDAKATQVHEVWRWVVGQRDKPDFGMPYLDP